MVTGVGLQMGSEILKSKHLISRKNGHNFVKKQFEIWTKTSGFQMVGTIAIAIAKAKASGFLKVGTRVIALAPPLENWTI